MKMIIGNWKMHMGVRESVALVRGVLRTLRGHEQLPEIIVCPSFLSLSEVHKVLARSRVHLGAQNCGPQKASGAFTGEVSTAMLEDVHAQYVIIGHSERRNLFHEDDQLLRGKMEAVYQSKLTPIFCVGESLDVREAGEAYVHVDQQIRQALKGVEIPRDRDLIIAYEPIWAIGSGESATVGDVVEMHEHIRRLTLTLTGIDSDRLHVLYGGSVNEDNAYQFLRESEIDGVLVGGASIKLRAFEGIIKAGIQVVEAQSN